MISRLIVISIFFAPLVGLLWKVASLIPEVK